MSHAKHILFIIRMIKGLSDYTGTPGGIYHYHIPYWTFFMKVAARYSWRLQTYYSTLICAKLWSEYCFTSISAQSWQYRDRKPKSGLCPTLIEWIQRFFVVHTAHYNRQLCTLLSLNSLEHCVRTTAMTNIWPDRDLNPQPHLMSHRGRPYRY